MFLKVFKIFIFFFILLVFPCHAISEDAKQLIEKIKNQNSNKSIKDIVLYANFFLEKIKKADYEWILKQFNSANKHILLSSEGSLSNFKIQFQKRISEASRLLEGINGISELREVFVDADSDTYVVTAKLFSEGENVFILTLNREGGQFVFDHLNFTEKRIYEKMKILWQLKN